MNEAVSDAVCQAVLGVLKDELEKLPWYRMEVEPDQDRNQTEIELLCKQDEESDRKTIVLRLYILHEAGQMGIPNIFMPEAMVHKRFGKRTIAAIFDVCREFGYELFVVDLVPAFKRRLLARGAHEIDHETVWINENTDLKGDVALPEEETIRVNSILDLLDQGLLKD